jgi:MFS family permease
MHTHASSGDHTAHRSAIAAWTVVGICFAVLSVSFAARSLLGLAMPYLQHDFGWSRSFVSSGGSLALVAMAAMSPIAGNLIDRYGARVLLFCGCIAIAIGMTLCGFMQASWEFLVAFSGIAGLGFGMAATHAVGTIVSLTFDKNRGLAVGTATAGSTAGQLVVVPVLAAVLASISWRWSYFALGASAFAMAAAVLIFVRPVTAAPKRAKKTDVATGSIFAETAALFRRPVFHLLLWSYVICGFTTSGIIEVHLLPYAAACGFPPLESAYAYGILSAVNLGGMVLSGWLTDRMHRPLLLGSIYILRGFSFIVLIWAAHDIRLLFLFAVLFGLFDYATVPVTASLAASNMGLRVLGLTMGLLSAGHALGAAIGAQLAGVLYDLYAEYLWVWVVAIALALFAGVLCFFIKEDRKTHRSDMVQAAALET